MRFSDRIHVAVESGSRCFWRSSKSDYKKSLIFCQQFILLESGKGFAGLVLGSGSLSISFGSRALTFLICLPASPPLKKMRLKLRVFCSRFLKSLGFPFILPLSTGGNLDETILRGVRVCPQAPAASILNQERHTSS